jgi:Family of unknown function (DUF6011)
LLTKKRRKKIMGKSRVFPTLKCIECGRESSSHVCDDCISCMANESLNIARASIEAPQIMGNGTQATLSKDKLEQFVLAGNATFTLWNTKKGTHLTYKVRVSKDDPTLFFVSILTGPDNWANYTFLGIIKEGIYWHGKKSPITKDSQSAKTFEWFYNNIDRLPLALQVLHEGKCGRCGRKLTVPGSVTSGFGPECINYV